jgi:hypothetical protein
MSWDRNKSVAGLYIHWLGTGTKVWQGLYIHWLGTGTKVWQGLYIHCRHTCKYHTPI